MRHCLNLEYGRSCAFCKTGIVRPIEVLLLGGVSKLVIEVKQDATERTLRRRSSGTD